MKVLDTVAPMWSLQRKEMIADETGKQFIDYLEMWCEAAERLLETDADRQDVRRRLLEAMSVPEEELGRIDGTYLGPMLMYMIHAWEYGKELGEQLSEIELKIVASAVLEQQARMQAVAEGQTVDTPEPTDA